MTQADLGEAINGDGAALIVTSVRMPLEKQTLPIAFLFCMIRSKRVQIASIMNYFPDILSLSLSGDGEALDFLVNSSLRIILRLCISIQQVDFTGCKVVMNYQSI